MTNQSKIKELIKHAAQVRKNAYAPYSKYTVGAAVKTGSGKVYTGCNVENAVYPLSICAERAAVFKAVSCGETIICAVAVVTQNGGTPCGSCRQVLREFGDRIDIYVADAKGNHRCYSLMELLPESFSSGDIMEKSKKADCDDHCSNEDG